MVDPTRLSTQISAMDRDRNAVWLERMAWMAFWGAVLSCGPSASDPYSALRVYDSPTGDYRVRFLSPPWDGPITEGAITTFRVKSNAETVLDIPLDAAGLIPAKYTLEVGVESGTPQDRVAQTRAELVSVGETIEIEPREIATRSGDFGWEVLSLGETGDVPRHRRHVFLGHSAGVVHLYFHANPSLDSREVTEMIRAVEVEPSRGAE